MKKFISLAMALAMAASLMAGCASDPAAEDMTNPSGANDTTPSNDTRNNGDTVTPENNDGVGIVDPEMDVTDPVPNDGVVGNDTAGITEDAVIDGTTDRVTGSGTGATNTPPQVTVE